jgi:glycosyltransferase involved in cell wall biosynthesis
MLKRKRIGVYFVFDNQTNSGIVNYLFSFVKSLKNIENSRKPHLVVIHSPTAPIEIIKNENYPYITFKSIPNSSLPEAFLLRAINKVSRILFAKNLVFKNKTTTYNLDYLFPFPHNNTYFNGVKKVHWLVDFNPYYFPDHLTQDQRKDYFDNVEKIVYSKDKVIISSFDIFKDLKKFHPNYTCQVEVLRFTAVLPAFNDLNVQSVKAKFDITKPFVITPNQFWVHKNHLLLFKAAKILKERGIDFQMIFTGGTSVEKDFTYFQSLEIFIEKNDLRNQIKILGIIDRSDQLILMKHSVAIVQPSLFEGWSTLVEESKALSKYIIVSDIAIHREQIKDNCAFFDPNDEIELSNILEKGFLDSFKVIHKNYDEEVTNYANRIIEIFN